MKSILSLALVAAALAVACGGTSASTPPKPSTPPGPVVKYKNTLPGLTAAAPIDLVLSIIDFAPGAASAVHTHSAPNLATVLQGQITVKSASGDRQGRAGDALLEPVNQAVQAVNLGAGEAMVAGAFPVPHGGKPTAAVAGQPAPATPNKTLYSFTLASPRNSAGFRRVHPLPHRTR